MPLAVGEPAEASAYRFKYPSDVAIDAHLVDVDARLETVENKLDVSGSV